MPAPDKKLYITRQQAADLCQLSARQFDDAVRTRLPEGAKRGSGHKLRYDATEVVAAFVAYRLQQAAPPADIDDPLMLGGGGDSPQLERYRKFKADLAERQVKEIDGLLVRREVIMNAMRPAISGMRGAGDRIIREYGNDAGEIYNEAVDDFEASMTRLIEEQLKKSA